MVKKHWGLAYLFLALFGFLACVFGKIIFGDSEEWVRVMSYVIAMLLAFAAGMVAGAV